MSDCQIVNSDGITRVSVCTPNIATTSVSQYNLTSSGGANPFAGSNTSGLNIQYFSTANGGFRAGNFRQFDLTPVGTQSAAIGFRTQATASGSVAYGINNGTIRASAAASLVGGFTDSTSSITSSSGSTASHVFGVATSSGIAQAFGESSLVHGTAEMVVKLYQDQVQLDQKYLDYRIVDLFLLVIIQLGPKFMDMQQTVV